MIKLPQLLVKKFLSKQLALPSGIPGKYIMGKLLNRMTSSHNELVFNQLNMQRSDRVLEIGFGGAALLEKIVESASEGFVAGIELSDEMVANAQLHFKNLIETGRVEIRKGNIESLSYPDSHFNKACSVNTINFWPNLSLCFAELFRVIKPGGKLILGYVADKDVRSAGLDERGFLVYSDDELNAALVAQGFTPGLLKSGFDRRGTYFALTAERAE